MQPAPSTTMDADRSRTAVDTPPGAPSACFHCGTPCRETYISREKAFCCQGCLTVFELLTENGLANFYELGKAAGVRIQGGPNQAQFKFLDEPTVRERLVDYADERRTRITFRTPAIHCIACVWLLENLFRLKPGIGHSQVNFPRKEISISFQNADVKLSEVVTLLASLGYEPELKFSDLEVRSRSPASRRLWLQLGVAGFAFGNIMLFSISSYLGLDALNGPGFKKLFGWISLVLATPVFFYSAADYWRSAWLSVRRRFLTIDVPIAAGIAALFAQSAYEVATGRGEGYFDSLAGLLFFLLCGKLFQQKTFDRLAFDRDYKSFFPLSVTRRVADEEEIVSLSQLKVGDRLLIRNGELIPADARLVGGTAVIDYSFVTGEAEAVEKPPGDHLYAGGRQVGGAIEVETVKVVSQGYLTSLWNQEAFQKEKADTLNTLTNRYSPRFTKLVIAVAAGAAVFWAFREPARAVKSFTSVLIVACPCALALAAPFALGTAQRLLGRRGVFLKNPHVLETLARVDAIIFDKTGTLTTAGAGSITFQGAPLSGEEETWVGSIARYSTHPNAVRIGSRLGRETLGESIRGFHEMTGCGLEGQVAGHEVWMGSASWLEGRQVAVRGHRENASDYEREWGGDGLVPSKSLPMHLSSGDEAVPTPSAAPPGRAPGGSVVHLAIDGRYRGCFVLTSALRPETDRLISNLGSSCDLALLSGDNERERERFQGLFGGSAALRFNQSPVHKLDFIRQIQASRRTVMMVGDGLNDAGALKQSDVGVAVVENISAFSPASDVILAAGMVARLDGVLHFSKSAVRVVRLSFLLSSLYNVVGISIAARGLLSPVVCAILMPLSSVTVVLFACGLTTWLAQRAGLGPRSGNSTSGGDRNPALPGSQPKRRFWQIMSRPRDPVSV